MRNGEYNIVDGNKKATGNTGSGLCNTADGNRRPAVIRGSGGVMLLTVIDGHR